MDSSLYDVHYAANFKKNLRSSHFIAFKLSITQSKETPEAWQAGTKTSE